MSDYYFVYVTFESESEANKIAKRIVELRLSSCANIFPAHKSIYWWEGELQNSSECAAIFKTTAQKFNALKDEIIELHSYDVPCIVALPIEKGHEPFLNWIDGQTKI